MVLEHEDGAYEIKVFGLDLSYDALSVAKDDEEDEVVIVNVKVYANDFK